MVVCYKCSVLAARNHGSQKNSQCINGDKRRDSWELSGTIVTRTELQLPVTTVMESHNGDPYPGRNLSLPQLLYAVQEIAGCHTWWEVRLRPNYYAAYNRSKTNPSQNRDNSDPA